MPSDESLKTSCYDEYVYYDDDAGDGCDDDDGDCHDDDDVDHDVMALVMVTSTAVKMMKGETEETGGVRRSGEENQEQASGFPGSACLLSSLVDARRARRHYIRSW